MVCDRTLVEWCTTFVCFALFFHSLLCSISVCHASEVLVLNILAWTVAPSTVLFSLLSMYGGENNVGSATEAFGSAQFFKKHCQQGAYHNLLQEARLQDPESHFWYMRMTRGDLTACWRKKTYFECIGKFTAPDKNILLSRKTSNLTCRAVGIDSEVSASGDSQVKPKLL